MSIDDLIVMKHTNVNPNARLAMANEYEKQPTSGSLEKTDEISKAVQKTVNRISLDQIKSKIQFIDYWYPPRHPHLTVCLLTLKNGFVVIGKSAPADPLNFDLEVGKTFAYEDAIRHIWPMEAYLLREKMSAKE